VPRGEPGEPEITEPVELCHPRGTLNPAAVGWTRRPLHRCNLTGHPLAKKRWNYWAFTSETHLFSATISNIDYAGLVFVYFADFESGEICEKTVLTPFGRGCRMPETVDESLAFASRRLTVSMEHRGESVLLSVNAAEIDGRPLCARFEVHRPSGHETLGVVIPWDERTFQFTSKHTALPSRGHVRWGEREVRFEGRESFACLDFGRGVWPRQCIWNWGAASGWREGGSVGLNLGGKWTDGTGMTENALCIDGRLTKVSETLDWHYDPDDFMQPWRIEAPSGGGVSLRFTPFLERVARANAGLVRSEVHQLFGRYDGHVIPDSGERIEVRRLVGWAEEHVARW
jgi:hypothetical protein